VAVVLVSGNPYALQGDFLMSGVGFAAVQTPVNNMGSNLQVVEAAVDWVTFTIGSISIGEVLRLLGELEVLAGDSFVPQDNGITRGRFYATWFRSVRGAELVCDDMTKEKVSARLNLPGGWVGAVGQKILVCQILPMFVGSGWKATRCDVNFDDYERRHSPQFVLSECDRAVLMHYRYYEYVGNSKKGFTLYVGSRTSDNRIRVYDKYIESKGEKNCIRWEAQLRDEKANSVVNEIVNRTKNLSDTIIDIVTGMLDFRENDDSNATRRTTCEWWVNFLGYLKAVPKRIPVIRVKPALERTVSWMFKQVETSLALIAECSTKPGFDNFLGSMLKSGKMRLNATHKAIVKLHKDNVESMPFLLAAIPH
jgi:hypothetical protein